MGYRGAMVPELIVRKNRLAVIGDTQETALLERLVGLEQNAARRAPLIAELARRAPDAVLHLGDLVTYGSSAGHWRRWDRLFAKLDGTPILPAVGNHDRMLAPGLGHLQMVRRFPWLAQDSWYEARYGGLVCLVLDSNLGLATKAFASQHRWLQERLRALESDPHVHAIIACWHHPPLTNSRLVRPTAVARALAGELSSARKVVALFNGHCHAYEHFTIGRLHAFVSGGGGGPRHRLETRPERRRAADLFAGGSLRFMHFLVLEVAKDGLVVEVVRMSDALGFDVADRVHVPF